jgi:hypothetical protein
VPWAYRSRLVALDALGHQGLNLHQYRAEFMAMIATTQFKSLSHPGRLMPLSPILRVARELTCYLPLCIVILITF